jgi:hypothetical protein
MFMHRLRKLKLNELRIIELSLREASNARINRARHEAFNFHHSKG